MRHSDAENKRFFRVVDRVYCMNGRWYYQTREADQGPFSTRGEAERDLLRYVEEMQHFAPDRSKTEGAVQRSLDFADLQLVEWEEARAKQA